MQSLVLLTEGTPFIIFLAIDPRIIIKAIETSHAQFFDHAGIGGHEYLEKIARLHDVSLDDAKRLPNIVISGGQCESPQFEPGSQS